MRKSLPLQSDGGIFLTLLYTKRSYRQRFSQRDMVHFQAAYKDTDVDIGIPRQDFKPTVIAAAKKIIENYHRQLSAYIKTDPQFGRSLSPCSPLAVAPEIAHRMAEAARLAGVGPMAAVAGAIAQYTAIDLVGADKEIIIENGGDIYLHSFQPRIIGLNTGESSVFNNRLGLKINQQLCPVGICTSSGTVGPALSFGCADAAVIIARSAIVADAVATAAGNIVRQAEDVKKAAQFAATIPGVLGAVIIAADKIAAWGKVELVPL